MNAIVALCHFCPEHGPRTLFCTQAFKYSDLPNNIEKSSSSELNSKDESSTKNGLVLDAAQPEPLQYESNDSTDKLNNFIQSQSSSPSQLTTARSNEKTNSLDKSTTNCKPCRAFDSDFHHYISYEKSIESTNLDDNSLNNRICYISQSQPNDTEVFSLVRKACLRTLHCEVCLLYFKFF
jgi:folliculin